MKQIMDRGILLIYCLSSAFFTEINTGFLTAFLCAVIYSCLHYYTFFPALSASAHSHTGGRIIFSGSPVWKLNG